MANSFSHAIVDSDIDGLICAVILKRVFPDIKVVYSNPGDVQKGNLPLAIDSSTIIADLPYIKGVGMYFDHHASNKPSEAYEGKWEVRESAASIIFEYFKDRIDLADLLEIMPLVNKFDWATLTIDDLENRSFFLRLIYASERFHEEFFNRLLEILVEKGPKALEKDEYILKRLEKSEKYIQMMKDDLPTVKEEFGKIVFLNLVNKKYSHVHISLFEYELKNFDVFVLYRGSEEKTRVTLYVNKLVKPNYIVDLLSVAKKMNEKESGGHTTGCGFMKSEGMSIEECTKQLKELIVRVL